MNDIINKYAQLKADLLLQKEEEWNRLQEELDAKDPIKQYEKLQRELAENKKKHSVKLKENRKREEKEKQFELESIHKEQTENEEKSLKNLENLFLKLGGNLEEIEEEEQGLHEDDIGLEPEVVEVAETQQEDVVEEPTGVVEETIGHEKDIEVDERGEEQEEIVEEEVTVEAVADVISKQEKDKEKSVKETPTSKRIKLLEEKVSKLIKDMSNVGGGGEVNLNKLDDVDTSGIANNKILKYNSSTSKWEMATDGGGGGGDVDLSAVDQNIIPDGDGTRDLGSSSYKWKDLYLSGSSIKMGTTTISIDESGEFQTQKAGDSSPSKVASFSKINIPFSKADGTTSSIETKSNPTTFSAFFDNMYVPFTKADGTEVTTLKLGS